MTGIESWSTNPASNTSNNGINIAENCPAANLNDSDRQIMANVREWYNDAQWAQYGDGDGSATVAYASATSFTIAGVDVTSAWQIGRRVKVVAATPGTIYGTISNTAFSTNTTVTVVWDSGSLSNEALTAYLGVPSATNTSIPPAAIGRQGVAVASAATITLGAGDYFHVTGTTTITDIDFSPDVAGRYAWLVFDDVLTLTHHATTLICPGGASITTAAGDACLVVSEGSDAVRVVTYYRKTGAALATEAFIISCSDETTAITAGTGKVEFRMPYAFTPSAVSASLTTAQASGNIFTVDINEAGTTILSTKLTIDNTEKTSATAATPAVISDAALASNAIITVDVDQIGDGTAKGLKVTLIGTRA